MDHSIKIEILEDEIKVCDTVICLTDEMIYEVEEIQNNTIIAVSVNGHFVNMSGSACFRKVRFIPTATGALWKKFHKKKA